MTVDAYWRLSDTTLDANVSDDVEDVTEVVDDVEDVMVVVEDVDALFDESG